MSKGRGTIGIFAGGAIALALAPSAPARQVGRDVIAEVNRTLDVPGTKDATEVLFGPLAAMQPPPTRPVGLRPVSLMTSSSPLWPAWDAWARGEKQQAVLGVLKTVCDPKSKYLLRLPYGRESVKQEWVSAGLFVDLGDPPLLALAPTGCRYLEAFDRLALLCTVEAERLASAGQADDCLAVLINWLRFARIVADRPFAREKEWAFAQMQTALERLADIACLHSGLFGESHVPEATRELDPRAIALDRIRFPVGERLALTQLISLTIEERGGVKPDAFGPVMGRLTADRSKPFDLFNQAAYWTRIGKEHAGWFDTREQVDKVFGDLQKRWDLNDFFDPLMQTATDYSKMDGLKFAMIGQMVKGVAELYDERLLTLTAQLGVRSALGAVGYRSVQGVWPPTLPAVQPRFVQSLDYDPWYFERERKVRNIYRYFVPMRDQPVGPRELPRPHAVRVSLERRAGMSPSGIAEGFDKAVWGLGQAAKLPVDAFDLRTGSVDAEKLRASLVSSARTEPVYESERRSLRATADAIIRTNIDSPDKWRLEIQKAFDLPTVRQLLNDEALAPTGLTFAEFRVLAERVAMEQFGTDAFKAILSAARQDRDPTDEEVRAMREATAGILASQGIIDDFISKILRKSAEAAAEEDAFTVELTDSDFVLYSVGSDGKADFAAQVGRAGPDILIWPPVLTLERRARGQ